MRPAFRLNRDVFHYCLSFFTERDLLAFFHILKDAKSDAVQAWVYGIERFMFAYNPNISREATTEIIVYQLTHQAGFKSSHDFQRQAHPLENIRFFYPQAQNELVQYIRREFKCREGADHYFFMHSALCRASKETLKMTCTASSGN